jgi:TolB-like protein
VSDEGIPIIVVLPLTDLTGSQAAVGAIDLAKVGQGIAEQITADLSTFPDFQVVSYISSLAYVGKSVPEIQKLTGATFVVGGTIRVSDGKATIVVEIINASADRPVEIAKAEEDLADPVILQKRAAEKIRDQLGGMTGQFRQEYNRIAAAKTEADRSEYDYYVLGHRESLRGRAEESGRVWKEGLLRFPKSALLHYKLMIYHLDTHDDVKQAEPLWAEVEKLEHRSRLDEWYRHWLGAWMHGYHGEQAQAVAEARATIAMAPYDAVSHISLNWVMREAGETGEALEWAKFAVTHDPNMYQFYFRQLIRDYFQSGTWADAVAFGEAQVVSDPVHAKWWYEFLDQAYQRTGQTEKSREAWKKALNLPEPPIP